MKKHFGNSLSFRLYFAEKTVTVSAADLQGEVCGDVTVYRASVDNAEVTWTHTPYAGGILVDLSVSSNVPLGIRRIDSVVCNPCFPKMTDHIALIGRATTENEIRFPSELGVNTEYCETAMGWYEDLSLSGSLVAGVSPFRNICAATACKGEDGCVTFCVKTEYTKSLQQATRLDAERAYVNQAVSIDEFYTLYRDLLPQSSFPMPKLTGWNTWDYYLDRVTAEDVFENVEALKTMSFADRLDYIVIDDGWQKGWGDWVENEKFSCGLSEVARRIREAGFIPGIWMTPVGVRDDVAVFRAHPEWFCRGEDGELFETSGLYYLDPTHPDARQFILDAYLYQYRAGFRLFKMDYVSPLLEIKDFYDKTATPYGVLADLVNDVKAYTGPDVVILGCSLPLECGADIAPSMRLGLDIHNHFSHVKAIARSIAWSSVYNNKITRVDPDFLVVRGEETADEPLIWEGDRNDYPAPPRAKQTSKDRMKLIWRHGDQFNALEAETWANLVALSGGNIFLSDRMSVLNERGIQIIENAFRLAGESLRPKYLSDDYRNPSVFLGDKALVVVNWEEIPRTVTVPGIETPLCSEKPFDLTDKQLTVTLLPHESFAAIYR